MQTLQKANEIRVEIKRSNQNQNLVQENDPIIQHMQLDILKIIAMKKVVIQQNNVQQKEITKEQNMNTRLQMNNIKRKLLLPNQNTKEEEEHNKKIPLN